MGLHDGLAFRRPRLGALCVCLLVATGFACGDDDDAAGEPQAGAAANGGSGSAGKSGAAAAGSGARAGESTAGSAAKAGAGASGAGAGGNGPTKAGSGGGDSDAGAAVCNLDCAQGMHCVLNAVQCVRAPCPAQPQCVADQSGAAGDMLDCDPSKVLCKRATPKCAGGSVPSVVGSCYGDCVPVEMCRCSQPSQCPLPDEYTCHMSAGHCGPFVE